MGTFYYFRENESSIYFRWCSELWEIFVTPRKHFRRVRFELLQNVQKYRSHRNRLFTVVAQYVASLGHVLSETKYEKIIESPRRAYIWWWHLGTVN